MKKIIKGISVLLALMLLVSGIGVIPASAADVTYSVSSVKGATGDTVSVSVSLSSSIDLWGSNVQLKYNPAELQVVSFAKGGAVSNGSINDSGTSVNFSGTYGAKSGTVFTVSFKILKESGKASLTLSSSENTDYNGAMYNNIGFSNGSIVIVNSVVAEKITLDKTSVTLEKGKTTVLKATVTPENATTGVTFYSSDDDVATVSDDGTITAVKGGVATITALSGEQSAKCTVTVSVPMTGIKADGSTTRKMAVGEKINLTVLKVPADATDKVTAGWSSSNPEIATVKAGVVTAVAVGEATITAKAGKWTVTYKITVAEKGDESTTAESTTDESTTIPESTTGDESTTESTTAVAPPTGTTEPQTIMPPYGSTDEDFSLVEPTTNKNALQNIDNPDADKYIFIVAAAVIAVVAGTVAFLVIRGYKGKGKKQKIIVEEKFR